MTDANRTSWGSILGRAAISSPSHAPADNVVRHPQAGLTSLANLIIDRRNRLIQIGIEIDRQTLAYNSAYDELLRAQADMAEAMKVIDAKVEFVNPFPVLERSGQEGETS